jgi:hypothetical protein
VNRREVDYDRLRVGTTAPKSEAGGRFEVSCMEIAQLREIHEDVSGTDRGKRNLEVLNKSAIVLICAIWEAYCEDLAGEALDHLLAKIDDPEELPLAFRKQVAKELKKYDLHELAAWKLAGPKWKEHLRGRLASFKKSRDFDWSTPSSDRVDAFFADAVGISRVSAAWSWKSVGAEENRTKLDALVHLRGAIAHRGRSAQVVKKGHFIRSLVLVTNLVRRTDEKVKTELRAITGVAPWS